MSAGTAGPDEWYIQQGYVWAEVDYLTQSWVVAAFPPPATIMAFVDDMATTMAVPLRRFLMWGDATREVKGALKNKRELVLDYLTHGYRGDPIECFSVFSWVYGGINHAPASQVNISDHYDGWKPGQEMQVEVVCERRMAPGEDPAPLIAAWAQIGDRHLDPVRPGEPARVRTRRTYLNREEVIPS